MVRGLNFGWRSPLLPSLLFFTVGLGIAKSGEPSDVIVIPTQFDEDRFFVVPTPENGEPLKMIADTGGGVFFFSDAAERLKLTVKGVNLGDYKGLACQFPTFAAGKGIPAPQASIAEGMIPVAPAPVRLNLSWFTKDIDGVLGESWFAGRVWTFDYVDKRLLLHSGEPGKSSDKARKIEMGLRKPSPGEQKISYPRVEAAVEGETLSFLLATGSSVAVTADALKELGGGALIRSTCLISNSVFERWRKDHPEWRFISNAEEGSGEPMIEVPKVVIAGFTVGPVWFTQRPDSNFRDNFSNWMDESIVGALGPNAFRGMRVTLDYSAGSAFFELSK